MSEPLTVVHIRRGDVGKDNHADFCAVCYHPWPCPTAREALFDTSAQPAVEVVVGASEEGAPTPLFDITVFGLPISQGSHRALVNRHTGRAVVVESNNTRLRPWREAVKQAALDAIRQRQLSDLTAVGYWKALSGPVRLEMTFTLPRPKNHYRTGRNAHLLRDNAPLFPTTKPDWDKLARSADSLTDAGVWSDDSVVVTAEVRKLYVGSVDALDRPGARIRIWSTFIGRMQ